MFANVSVPPTRHHRTARRTAILVALVAALAFAGIGASSALANEGATLDQCGNGKASAPTGCPISAWQNGNLNAQQAHYAEGESIPYRLVLTGLTAGTHTVKIGYDTTKSGLHAIDYLTTFNRTETGTDACSDTTCANVSTFPIPSDPHVTGSITQVPGVFTLYATGSGSALTGTSGYTVSGSYSGDSTTFITIDFTTTDSNGSAVLTWGGHISDQHDWGVGTSAISINGSPYHMLLDNLDGSGGSQDRSLSAAAVKATPTLATTATDSGGTVGKIGDPISDTVHLTAGFDTPSGNVTFSLYPPSDPTCGGAAVFTSIQPVTAEPPGSTTGATATSGPFTTTATGTYHWIASYAGDSNNVAVAGTCGDAGEGSAIGTATPTLATSATSGTAGGAIHDVATVTGGVGTPTGAVTFNVYDPSNANCAGAPVATFANVALNGSGVATSPDFTTTQAGTYHWVASYGGDSKYAPAAGTCGAANESSNMAKANPALATSASSETVGHSIHDVATLTGVANVATPTGTVTFNLYAPGDTSCTGTAVATFTGVPISGGVATSPDYTTTESGDYRWIATYNGDGNYNTKSGTCGDSGETSTVLTASLKVVKSGPATALVGSAITYTYTVTNTGNSPLSSVTVSDDKCSPVTLDHKSNDNGDNVLDNPGVDGTSSEVWVYTCSLAAPAGVNSLVNTVTVGATDEFGHPITPGTDQHTVTILHPAISISKSGPATATAGSLVAYTLIVTNTGDESFAGSTIKVSDPLCKSAPTLVSVNGDGTPGTLDPGDRWSYTCSVQTTAGQTTINNVATVSGTDSFGKTVASTAAATTPLSQVVVEAAALQCQNRKLVLINVLQRGSRAYLTGAADRKYDGRKVNIYFGPHNQLVATPTVDNKGQFATFVPLPPAKIRDTNLARYQARIGAERSLNLKFRRRMVVTSLTSTPGLVHISGQVLPPLTSPRPALIKIQRRVSCSTLVTERTIKADKHGRFSVTLLAPPALQAAAYRAATVVLKFAHSPNKKFPTFTLPQYVDLLH